MLTATAPRAGDASALWAAFERGEDVSLRVWHLWRAIDEPCRALPTAQWAAMLTAYRRPAARRYRVLYRGARLDYRAGLAWTPHYGMAELYAADRGGSVWMLRDVPAEAIIADWPSKIAGEDAGELVIDPAWIATAEIVRAS